MYPYNRLALPFSILVQATRMFILGQWNFWLLVFLSMFGKIFRFISALLPFKALMLIISGDRVFHFLGTEIPSSALAGAFIVATVIFYLSNMLITGAYNGCYAHLFGEHSPGRRAKKRRKPHNPAQKPVLNTTIDFYSAALIVIILSVTLSYIYPLSLILLAPALFIYATVVAIKIEPVGGKKFKVGEFSSRYSFGAMVIVLLFLAALVGFGYQIGFLTALFFFISTRQIFTNMGEISRSLFTLNMPHTYKLVREHFDAIDIVAPLPNWASFPYLNDRTQRDWLSQITGEVLGETVEVSRQQWRETPMFSVHSFAFDGAVDRTDRRFIINIFNPVQSLPCKQERAFIAAHSDHPLVLPFLGTVDRAILSVNLFESEGFEAVEPARVPAATPIIIANLWSGVPDGENGLRAREPAFLTNLDAAALEILRATDSFGEHVASISAISEQLEAIKNRICALPDAYFNPDLTQATILTNSRSEFRLSIWARAGVEILGCQLADLPQSTLARLPEILDDVRSARPDCAHVHLDDVLLAGKVFALSRSIRTGAYSQAIKGVADLAEFLQSENTARTKPLAGGGKAHRAGQFAVERFGNAADG